MMTANLKTDLEKQANELAVSWVLVGTNQGTYSAQDAMRAIRVGDPQFADCMIYEQVGTGKTRVDGCDEERCPGYIRRFGRELAEKQSELKKLREQIKSIR